MVDALIPLLFMIALLATSIVLFGLDAAVGPLQVALLMSAVVAAVVAHKNGHSWERLGEEIVKGISLAMTAIMILLMVGALIGVWNMSGTDCHDGLFRRQIYRSILVLPGCSFALWNCRDRDRQLMDHCGDAGVSLSGWPIQSATSTTITAGAVISGAYFGDKMTPLSETTILTPQIVGSNVYTHISSMAKATIPAYLISLRHLLLHREKQLHGRPAGRHSCCAWRIKSSYNISLWNLLPVLVLLLLGMKKFPAFLSILIGTLAGALVAVVLQPAVVVAFCQ